MTNMRRLRVLVLAACGLASTSSMAEDGVTGEQMRDDVIQIVVNGGWTEHTCRRVAGLGKGTVSPEECASRLATANAECIELGKSTYPRVMNKTDGEGLVSLLVACPVAKVLRIGHKVHDGKLYVQWSEIGAGTSHRP